jgi:hypothetical protein
MTIQGYKMLQYNNWIFIIDAINVWAVCHESGTYGSAGGKARKSLPIPTSYPSSPFCEWWMP